MASIPHCSNCMLVKFLYLESPKIPQGGKLVHGSPLYVCDVESALLRPIRNIRRPVPVSGRSFHEEMKDPTDQRLSGIEPETSRTSQSG